MDLCFFSIEEFLNSSVKMVINGGEKGMGELLQKHTNDLRCLSSFRDSELLLPWWLLDVILLVVKITPVLGLGHIF